MTTFIIYNNGLYIYIYFFNLPSTNKAKITEARLIENLIAFNKISRVSVKEKYE